MRSGTRVVRMVVAVVALGMAVPACGSKTPTASRSTSPTATAPYRAEIIGKEAPDFSLRDQFDRPHRLSDFHGKVVLLTFVSSRCKTFCPLTAELLARTQDILGTRAGEVQVVAVNANYRYTAIHDVLRWSQEHSMTHRWLFLTAQAATLWKVYNAYGVTPGAAHTILVFLIDTQGRIRGVVPIAAKKGLDAEAAVLAKSVGSLEGSAA